MGQENQERFLRSSIDCAQTAHEKRTVTPKANHDEHEAGTTQEHEDPNVTPIYRQR